MNNKTKTWEDLIVAEIRSIRDAHARKFNYNLVAIVDDLMKKQRQREAQGRKFVTFSPPDNLTTRDSTKLIPLI